jgi:hypothetical protein
MASLLGENWDAENEEKCDCRTYYFFHLSLLEIKFSTRRKYGNQVNP